MSLCEIGHQGLMHDKEFGLIHNRARYLHPVLGRCVQRDPMGSEMLNLLTSTLGIPRWKQVRNTGTARTFTSTHAASQALPRIHLGYGARICIEARPSSGPGTSGILIIGVLRSLDKHAITSTGYSLARHRARSLAICDTILMWVRMG